ncbi:ParA family protein (plasmid) [Photobacterium damselae subsp. damselae]|uniref:ParA family protein n=1 Tax=Photobacterium damselae TaxID=38293 RepID=UPI00311B3582
MKSIVLLSSKGGVGKSSIIKQIHRELIRLGFSVWGKDTDPQGTYESFLQTMVEPEHADFYLYDTQGADSVINRTLLEAVSQSDDCLIIVPVQPTSTDRERALSVAHLLHQFNVKDKSIFVLNRCYREADKETVESKSTLRSFNIKVANAVIVNRIRFDQEPTAKIRNDISKLIHEVIL